MYCRFLGALRHELQVCLQFRRTHFRSVYSKMSSVDWCDALRKQRHGSNKDGSLGKAIKRHMAKLKLFLKDEGIAVARQVLEQNVYKFLRIAVVVMVAMARKDVQKHVATLLVEQVKLSLA